MIIQEVLLINEEYVKRFSTVSDNMDSKYIVPCIVTSQVQRLQPLVGTKLTKLLCELVKDDTIDDTNNVAYKELLDEYVQPFLLAYTQSEMLISNSYKLRNAGNVQYLDTNQSNITSKDVQFLSKHYEDQGVFLGNRMVDWLRCHTKQVPEYLAYCNECCGGMQANKDNDFGCNIVL